MGHPWDTAAPIRRSGTTRKTHSPSTVPFFSPAPRFLASTSLPACLFTPFRPAKNPKISPFFIRKQCSRKVESRRPYPTSTRTLPTRDRGRGSLSRAAMMTKALGKPGTPA